MIVGATVFAALLLLLLVAERAGSVVWHDGAEDANFYCAPCDLRYPLRELSDPRTRICPRGHSVEPIAPGFPVGTFLIAICVAFVALGSLFIFIGRMPSP